MELLFSVLIPAYNAEKYLKECVDSIVGKTEPYSFEIVIANDGSVDNTAVVCDELSEKYKNVHVYHKENEGLIKTRQFLINHCQGRYILFVDADDTCQHNYIETISKLVKEYNEPDIVVFGFNIKNGESITPYRICENTVYLQGKELDIAWRKLLCSSKFNSMWTKAIRREVIIGSMIPSEWHRIRNGEDKLQSIFCLEKCSSLVYSNEYIYNYRIDNDSMTRTFRPDYFDDILFVVKYSMEKLIEKNLLDENTELQWSVDLLDKFENYVLQIVTRKVEKKIVRERINYYRNSKEIQTALCSIKRNGRFKQKIKYLALRINNTGLYSVIYKIRSVL